MGVETWNDAPAANADGGWKPDTTGADGDGWKPDTVHGGDDEFIDGFAPENVSKHANGDFEEGPRDGGCRNCGADGHFARDCPEEKKNSGECYNCGQMGHNKADCPNERVEREFTGTCRLCEQVGHRAADCPSKPPSVCKLCQQEGHVATECSVNRMFTNFAGMELSDEMSGEDAWAVLEAADKEKDIEGIKQAVLQYAKTYPKLTFEELEQVFREASMNTYLIAKQQEISDTHTIVNLQGKADQKYVVSFQLSAKPRRAKFAEGWPETPEENITRLAEAGLVMDRMVPKCDNCGQLGHTRRGCTEEKQEKEKAVITCMNCNDKGHRARDCPQPRKTPGARTCKNCGEEGHISKECDKPRSAENVECKNCGEMGHFSRDCPLREPEICRNCQQEGHRAKDCTNERIMKCRNCDELGHISKECPKPTDWSRVECTNCKQKGHSYKRCPNPPAETPAEDGIGGGNWDNNGGGTAVGNGGDYSAGGWVAVDAPAVSTGSGGW